MCYTKDMDETKDNKEKGSAIRELVLAFFSGILKDTGASWFMLAKQKVHDACVRFEREMLGIIILSVGLIFMFVGLARFIESMVTVEGIGYAVVGLMLALLGLLLKLK